MFCLAANAFGVQHAVFELDGGFCSPLVRDGEIRFYRWQRHAYRIMSGMRFEVVLAQDRGFGVDAPNFVEVSAAARGVRCHWEENDCAHIS